MGHDVCRGRRSVIGVSRDCVSSCVCLYSVHQTNITDTVWSIIKCIMILT